MMNNEQNQRHDQNKLCNQSIYQLIIISIISVTNYIMIERFDIKCNLPPSACQNTLGTD